MKTKDLFGLAFLLGPMVAALAAPVPVPGKACPWLAGMPDGSQAAEDLAPAESPVLVPGITLSPGMMLTFTVSGGVARDSSFPIRQPDGAEVTSDWFGPYDGMAQLTAPYESLTGVFLGSDEPDLSPPPANSIANINASQIQPLLKQPFFIGDGLTSSHAFQRFTVPQGATRLFLGAMDCCHWHDNQGQFSVEVNAPTVLTIQESNGYINISVMGPSGTSNQIQYANALGDTNWQTLTNIVLSSGPFLVIDSGPMNNPQRFYRAVRTQ